MHAVIAAKKEDLAALCRRFDVARLEIFGSAARAVDFNPDASDVDFLVEFHRNSRLPPLEQFFDLAEALKQLLGRPVDLLESGAARFAIRSFWRESTGRAGSSMQRESRAYLWDV